MVLVGDEKQLDAVDAGKPFAQLQRAGMTTARMDEIMRQRDAELKEAVRASLAGEVKTAFNKLGERIAEAEPDNLAGAAAARWLMLPEEEREKTGLMAPSHSLRQQINAYIRERLVRDGAIRGPGMKTNRLVSRGLHPCRDDRGGQLRAGRHRGVSPPVQEPRGGERRTTAGARSGSGHGHRLPVIAGRRRGRVAAPARGRKPGRGGGLQEREHRAARPATASAGRGTTSLMAWSTATWRRSWRWGRKV